MTDFDGATYDPERAPPLMDTLNKFAVGALDKSVVVLIPPQGPVSPDDALLLAAYLVAIAEPSASHPFADVLAAVRAT